MELFENLTFWSAFFGWFIAQGAKLLSHFVRTRQIDFRYLVSTGGMPSAHSAMSSALATSVAIVDGVGCPLFALSVAFAGIVMFDAQSVRHATGTQARLLNQIVDELFKEHHLSQQKLAELLGHTPLEVFLGMVMGILTAFIVHFAFV